MSMSMRDMDIRQRHIYPCHRVTEKSRDLETIRYIFFQMPDKNGNYDPCVGDLEKIGDLKNHTCIGHYLHAFEIHAFDRLRFQDA